MVWGIGILLFLFVLPALVAVWFGISPDGELRGEKRALLRPAAWLLAHIPDVNGDEIAAVIGWITIALTLAYVVLTGPPY